MFNITSDFLDDFEKHPIREILSYHHKLQYETDEEVESIEVENLPKGLFFRNGVISGNMYPLNIYHPIKDYESMKADVLDKLWYNYQLAQQIGDIKDSTIILQTIAKVTGLTKDVNVEGNQVITVFGNVEGGGGSR